MLVLIDSQIKDSLFIYFVIFFFFDNLIVIMGI